MTKNNTNYIRPLLHCLSAIALCLFFSGCFTGIESTKKINLSREDKKALAPTQEEKFMAGIKATPLKEWQIGKHFVASDNKALLVVVPRDGLIPIAPDSIKGKILEFGGVESKINAAGDLTATLLFSDGIYVYTFDTGHNSNQAWEDFKSDQVPMLIDEEMVDRASDLLIGKKFWSRTNLWYDRDGNRMEGRKYVPLQIIEVTPGDMVFPLKLKVRADDGQEAFLFMNFGNAENESRSFHNLFSFTDIRKHYPSVDDETWNLICRGLVKEGMTKEECRLALGNPTDLNSGHDYSQTLDIWIYENGKALWFEDGRLVKIR